MNLINQYFPDLSEIQKTQFRQLLPLYEDWNQKINVISRKDINNLYERHVLHSLAIGKFIQFKPGSQILDLGTGGGFPGIPLAILFPDAHFHLVDSIGKKLKVIKNIAGEIGLTNIKTSHSRVEDIHEKVDFVVCRAVAPIEKLVHWTKKIYLNHMIHGFPNGLIVWYMYKPDLSKGT